MEPSIPSLASPEKSEDIYDFFSFSNTDPETIKKDNIQHHNSTDSRCEIDILTNSCDFKHPYSDEDKAHLIKIQKTFMNAFEGKVFPTKEELRQRLAEVGASLGVYMSTSAGTEVRCTRGGDPSKSSATVRNSASSMPCCCPFKCVFAYEKKSFPDPNNPKVKTRANALRTTDDLKRVIVTSSSCWIHDNGCLPSYEQYHFQAKKAGNVLQKQCTKMNDLLNILHLCNFQMNNTALRANLKLVNPSNK